MNALTAKTSELIKKKKTESEENCVGKKISKKDINAYKDTNIL